MGRAKLTKSGKWRLRSYIGVDSKGVKHYQSFTCDTESQCYKAEKQWLKSGGGVIVEPKEPTPTVDNALEQYIESCRNDKRKTYSPRTIKEYESCRANGFMAMGQMQIGDVTTDDVQDLIDARSAQGRSTKTIKNAVYLLKPALETAGNLGINWRQLKFPEQEEEDYIIPTDQEIIGILEYLKKNDLQMYQAVVLGAFCGCRRSEICALTYGDVDRTAMQVHISKAVVQDENCLYQEKETKTRAGKRDIDIDQTIYDSLMIRQKNDGVIYAHNVNLTGLTPEALSSRYKRLKEKLGLKFCFHGLRHYHASVMVALNIPKAYAASQMGHSDYTMIEKVYGQIVREKEKAVSALINNHASQVLSGSAYNW